MKKRKLIIIILILVISIVIFTILYILGFIPRRYYTSADFNIQVEQSSIDFNNNGIDDYTDILLGARKDANNHPKYVSDSYTTGGYPPDDIGVCTDVVWRAFKNAGYSLKDMVDKDITENLSLYPAVNNKPDSNIDFRRVRNLKVFFDRYSKILTNDIYDIDKWQAGDIVIFGTNYNHIGIISHKRNKRGIPYLIHNGGQPKREEDILELYIKFNKIVAHYRFDMSNKE